MKIVIDKKKLQEVKAKQTENREHTILLVDDEPANIDSLTTVLEEKYHVISAQTGSEALDIIKKNKHPEDIHLIISDQRMPGMTGVEFLKQTIPIIPKSIRIILTGYTDIKDTIDSINEGQVYKYFTKPIDPKFLMVSLQRALEAYELEKQNILLIEQLKKMNENLERLVNERTRQLEESYATLKTQNEDLEYLATFQDTLVNQLEHLSITDPLTGLANRRWLESYTREACEKAARNQKELSTIMIDIDHFKLYNDFYGHAMGDKCIKIVTEIIKNTIRAKTDLAARYGGEEFCCVLSETNKEEAYGIAKLILEELANKKIPHEKSKSSEIVTISLGIYTTLPAGSESWLEVIRQADDNLYKAKENGRNQIYSN